MTEVIKMTSKGQVTLPIDIREAIGLDKDSYILVELVGDYILMKKAEVRMREIQKLFEKEAKKKKITKGEMLRVLKAAQEEVWAE